MKAENPDTWIQNQKLLLRVLFIIIICLADVIWSTFWIYTWKEKGVLVPSSHASSDLCANLYQNFLLILLPCILFFVFLLFLTKLTRSPRSS